MRCLSLFCQLTPRGTAQECGAFLPLRRPFQKVLPRRADLGCIDDQASALLLVGLEGNHDLRGLLAIDADRPTSNGEARIVDLDGELHRILEGIRELHLPGLGALHHDRSLRLRGLRVAHKQRLVVAAVGRGEHQQCSDFAELRGLEADIHRNLHGVVPSSWRLYLLRLHDEVAGGALVPGRGLDPRCVDGGLLRVVHELEGLHRLLAERSLEHRCLLQTSGLRVVAHSVRVIAQLL
mmetsp:Transcript_35742/g.101697  ORF Transcript_35742/g.101697 Transcript_35742/m.101697 type:complete len:237 (-) Transcript_35742:344-1054(-)